MRDQWSAERIDLLRRLWAGGATAAAIAAQLGGLSRSAVLGKILRLRRTAEPAAAPKPRLARRRRRKPAERPPPPPQSNPKPLLELTNNCCRWPVAGTGGREILFCAAPEADLAGGMPYCAYHARRAYVIPPSRVATEKPKAASPKAQSATSTRQRRYVWRAPVRHPAPRPR